MTDYRNMIGHLLKENSKLSMKCSELHTLVESYRINSYVVHAIKEMASENEGVLIWFDKGEFVVSVFNHLIEPVHDKNMENAVVKTYVEWYQLEQKGDNE